MKLTLFLEHYKKIRSSNEMNSIYEQVEVNDRPCKPYN